MQAEFEKYLKNSDYLRDVVNTNRNATAQIIGALILLITRTPHPTEDAVRQLLRQLENPGQGPSQDVERRRILALIGDYMKPIR